jgi:xanthine dehydrogenase accessory factor
MQTQEKEILEHALSWLQSDLPLWLCTIVGTVGSSPRPTGSMLLLRSDGLQVGSVSGGCVEEDLLERLRSGQLVITTPQTIVFGVSPQENERLGLPCGGRLNILIQQLTLDDSQWLASCQAAIDQRECRERLLDLASGLTTTVAVARHTGIAANQQLLRQCFGPRMRMLLVGAGQLSQSLSELALAMDYEVLVTDSREEMLAQWEGPDVPLLQGMPDDVVREHASDRHSIVITLTHDPRIDDMALMEALTTEAFYVGALGSMKTTEKRLARLRQLDLSDTQIQHLHAPVGLDIGSKTPLEIAVAIMAQLTQLRRKQP